MKTTVFKIPEEIKRSQEYLYFPLKSPVVESPVPAPTQSNVLESYKKYIKERREDERRTEFPAGVRFIEPTIKLRKIIAQEQIVSHRMEKKNIHQEKEPEFKTVKLKDLLKERGSFVLIADSGLGKTTILKELQYQIVIGDLPTEQIPIYFHFRDLLGVFSTEALLERIMDAFPEEIERDALERTVNSLFHQKRILFLLDGLDQVEDRSNLPKLLDRNGVLSYHRIVLAGRPYIYSSLQSLLSHYHYLTLDTFSITLAKEYLGEESFAQLGSFLQESSLRAPMLLSILKELGREAGQEINRTQIYEKMIDKLLSREADFQTIQSGTVFSKEGFKDIFSKLSYSLLDKGYAGRFPWSMVDSLLPELKITLGDFVRFTHLGLVSEVIEGSPLPDRDLEFRHQSFQEYLASLELKKRLLGKETLNKGALIHHLEYNKWDEVLSFLIGSLENLAAREIILFISCYDIILAGKCIAYYKGNKDEDFREFIDGLFRLLKDKEVRGAAAEALGKIGSERAIDCPIPLLSDKDKYVHWTAAEVLGNIGSEVVVDCLIPLLSNKDNHIRRAAAEVLGNIGLEKAVDHLVPLLSDKGEYFRQVAAWALGKIGSEKAADHLIPLLSDKDEFVRRDAAEALGKIGSERAVDHLMPLLNDKNENVRGTTAEALGKIGSEKAVDHLIPLLSDKDRGVRWTAALALGKIGSEKTVDRLIPLLSDKDRYVRRAVAEALGNIGSEKTVDCLIPLLSDEDVRRTAAWALGKIGLEKAVDHLIPLLSDKNENVRWIAAYALGEIGAERAVDSLIPLLNDEDVRLEVASVLGNIGSEKAVDHLIPLLSDKDVRQEAARSLGKIGSEKAADHLIPLLSDEDVRRTAAWALGKIGLEKAVDHLIPLLIDEDGDVSEAATEALGNISKKMKEDDLLRLIESFHKEGYNEAVDTLKKVHKRRFLKILSPQSLRIIK